MNGMEDITNSKLAFMDTTGYIYYVGNFVEENGVKFSNTSYKDWGLWYNYGLNDSLLTYKNDYDCDGYIDDNNLLPLESNWYVEYDGKWEEVGDRVLSWNLMTGELYELTSGKMILLDVLGGIYVRKIKNDNKNGII